MKMHWLFWVLLMWLMLIAGKKVGAQPSAKLVEKRHDSTYTVTIKRLYVITEFGSELTAFGKQFGELMRKELSDRGVAFIVDVLERTDLESDSVIRAKINAFNPDALLEVDEISGVYLGTAISDLTLLATLYVNGRRKVWKGAYNVHELTTSMSKGLRNGFGGKSIPKTILDEMKKDGLFTQ